MRFNNIICFVLFLIRGRHPTGYDFILDSVVRNPSAPTTVQNEQLKICDFQELVSVINDMRWPRVIVGWIFTLRDGTDEGEWCSAVVESTDVPHFNSFWIGDDWLGGWGCYYYFFKTPKDIHNFNDIFKKSLFKRSCACIYLWRRGECDSVSSVIF